MAGLVLKDICKKYESDTYVVNNFNINIEDKEFIVLVGPSGCGKSTTLRMIAGLEEISNGEVFIGEKLVNHVAPKDRDIAMVFQNYALYPHMSVYDNMAFALKLRKISKCEIDKRVNHAAKILGIEELLKRKPKQLSGGQRQRVAIGRAIVREPQVFLMDEPLSNLDAKLRNQMRAELIKLHKKLDTTFIYVTHDQIEAMTLGSRIVVMKDGSIQQIGSPNEIYEHPTNIFVASFIGTPEMNFFNDATLSTQNGKYIVNIFGCHYVLSDETQEILTSKRRQAGRIIVGIRPDDFAIVDNHKNAIEVKIDVCEMMGSVVHLHTKVLVKQSIESVEQNGADLTLHINVEEQEVVLCVKSDIFHTDTSINILPNTSKIHLFDPVTKQNITAI